MGELLTYYEYLCREIAIAETRLRSHHGLLNLAKLALLKWRFNRLTVKEAEGFVLVVDVATLKDLEGGR